ncbi:hypothetical protein ACFYXC_38160 [Streptomyces sp. NPDC002701]|uniref:hypothetical protein n=1 Tax=Streptomyces sp. NPDC002701 TaxID=3364661 RepID=UPI00367A6F58
MRRLTDSAVGGRRTVVELRVRRFRCQERGCAKTTFAGQVDGLPSATAAAAVVYTTCCSAWR